MRFRQVRKHQFFTNCILEVTYAMRTRFFVETKFRRSKFQRRRAQQRPLNNKMETAERQERGTGWRNRATISGPRFPKKPPRSSGWLLKSLARFDLYVADFRIRPSDKIYFSMEILRRGPIPFFQKCHYPLLAWIYRHLILKHDISNVSPIFTFVSIWIY